MLPSCGHFKNIPCPFYKLALCVRPHCPYKHQNRDNGHQRQIFSPLVDETESLFDSKVNLNAILQKSSYPKTVEVPEKATYIPTPVDSNSKPPGILKTNNSSLERASTSFVPEYKPTPISKLKEFNPASVKSVKSEYCPEFPTQVRKKKNVEEYDPTEVKCIPKKSVTFVDQTDTGDGDIPLILISDEEEEEDLDDLDNAPKFSDDDLDEDSPSISNSAKQVPEIDKPVKEEVVLIDDDVKINEYSVVDKILVDCKKNELLLNKKLTLPKVSDSASKHISAQHQDKNKPILSEKPEGKNPKSDSNVSVKNERSTVSIQKSEVKNHKSEGNISIKIEKNSVNIQKSEGKNHKRDSNANLKNEKNSVNVAICKTDAVNSGDEIKNKKEINSDLVSKSTKLKKSDHNYKKEKKNDKTEKSKEKSHKHDSHSSHIKEKHKKDSKELSDKSKHSKKIFSDVKKTNSHEIKNSKYDNHTVKHDSSLAKKHSKKRLSDGEKGKQSDSDNSHTAKKSKYAEGNSVKSLESDITKYKEKTSSSKHIGDVKRKSIDSDSDYYSSKKKSPSPEKKKIRTEHTSDTKKSKSDNYHHLDVQISKPEDTASNSDDDQFNDILSSCSESDPDEECRRIFNECYPETSEPSKDDHKGVASELSKGDKKKVSQKNESGVTDLVILRKKRYAHPGAVHLKPPNKQNKIEVKRPLNPSQVMLNRFAQCQAKFSRISENKDTALNSSGKHPDKKRINFVSNQNLLAAVKNKVNQSNPALSNFSPLPSTVTKTLKVTKRVAHIPEAALKPRPIIPADFGSKVPSNVRQKFLNAFIDECLKFCLSEDEAYEQALDEEKRAYERSSSKALYMNVAANTLKRLRNRGEEGPKVPGSESASSKKGSSQPDKKTVSHEAVLNGPLAQRRSFSIGRKKQAPEIKDRAELYEYLLPYVLTPEQLKENGFPCPHPKEPDRAVIEGVYASRAVYCNDAFKRTCCRCQKTYYVNVDGDYVRDEECDFHWGRLWKKRIAGSIESRYSCCQGDAESDGCCVSTGHVFEGSEAHALKGFVKTLPKTPPRDGFYGIYALDCEMCYTTAGSELTRITVIDTDLKPVYESFVKPQHQVLDYNTRFSGITEDNLKNVRTTLHDVQAVLLCIFNDKTILIGHSLESDFKALKLFHRTVVDTSVVFPHKNGLPFKRALRTLMAEKLNKIIQNDVGGHDSQEDAAACMELMWWKVKEDIKGNR